MIMMMNMNVFQTRSSLDKLTAFLDLGPEYNTTEPILIHFCSVPNSFPSTTHM